LPAGHAAVSFRDKGPATPCTAAIIIKIEGKFLLAILAKAIPVFYRTHEGPATESTADTETPFPKKGNGIGKKSTHTPSTG
jgi:hypothetical protein